ncbi:MAG: hypothetical protein ACAH80_02910 [Alphaproteobacteria bacterium]
MKKVEIPDFIYRGAIIDVDGCAETVKDFSVQIPIVNGKRIDAQVLYLQFKSGKDMVFDAKRVKEIPGQAPEFLKVGAKIFCRDLSQNNNDAYSRATAGEWTVNSVHREDKDHGIYLRVRLTRPIEGTRKYMTISRQFNAKTMTAINDNSEPDLPPAYELQEDLMVRKPIIFKPK